MSNYLPIVFVAGIVFMFFGAYILFVDHTGPPGFKIGPMFADNNNTLIQSHTGIDFNLSFELAAGIIGLVMGAVFSGLVAFVYLDHWIHPTKLDQLESGKTVSGTTNPRKEDP